MEEVKTDPTQKEKQPGLKETASDLTDHIEDLATTYYRLGVIKLTQKATVISSHLLAAVVACVFGFFVLLFGGLALSWWLGNIFENRVAGFLLGGGVFLVLMVTIILLRKQIVFPIFRNMIIRRMYAEND